MTDKQKAEKWDKLKAEIDRFYVDANGEYSEENPQVEGDLCDMGEIVAMHMGWL